MKPSGPRASTPRASLDATSSADPSPEVSPEVSPQAPPPALVVVTESGEQTRELGRLLGTTLRPGDTVLLHGDLGAGKTTLAQGIALGLGVEEAVRSPTFTLVEEHDGRDAAGAPLRLFHLDLYRVTADDLDGFGFDDYLAPAGGVTLIEWPERAADRFGEGALLVRLEPDGPSRRRIIVSAIGDDAPGTQRLDDLRGLLPGVRPALGEPEV